MPCAGWHTTVQLQAVVTRWGADRMSYGSYSSVKVGSLGAEDYRTMAENVGGVVFFAGEATTDKYPATMHGAFLSGLREVRTLNSGWCCVCSISTHTCSCPTWKSCCNHHRLRPPT